VRGGDGPGAAEGVDAGGIVQVREEKRERQNLKEQGARDSRSDK